MAEEEKAEVIEFSECKACGSKDTLISRLQKKVKEKGLKIDGFPECLGAIEAVMQSSKFIPIVGQIVPAGLVNYDVCMGCGALRAIRVSMAPAIRGTI